MSSELEQIEADTRRAMARHAGIAPRGFDTIAQRARIHAEIDDLLDRYRGDVPKGSREQAALLAVYERNADHGNPESHKCGMCGRSRYVNTRAARICMACDGAPVGSHWTSLDVEGAE